MAAFLMVLVLLAGYVVSEQPKEQREKAVQSILGQDFQEFISQKSVTVVYFFKKGIV